MDPTAHILINPMPSTGALILMGILVIIILAIRNFRFIIAAIESNNLISNFINKRIYERNTKKQTLEAAKHAQRYISYLENDNLMLLNTHCQVILDKSAEAIQIIDNTGYNQTIVAENFYAVDIYRVWNTLCYSFNDNTNFDAVSEFVRGSAKTITVNKKLERKIDINSCSQAQLVKLPGINTAMSVRIIKYREENNGFSSVDEFFKKFKIKDHFQRQLIALIEARKTQNYEQIMEAEDTVNKKDSGAREVDF